MNVTSEIQSPRLLLARSTIGRLSALITGPHEYERVFGHRVVEGYIEYPDVLPYSLNQALHFPDYQHWWLPYLIIHLADAALVGVCGYKGPPDDDGVVEIGYGIAPVYQGKGLGKEIVAALKAHALVQPGVSMIRAHTLPQPGPSAAILGMGGFSFAGDYNDPDDGHVWRWELKPQTAHET